MPVRGRDLAATNALAHVAVAASGCHRRGGMDGKRGCAAPQTATIRGENDTVVPVCLSRRVVGSRTLGRPTSRRGARWRVREKLSLWASPRSPRSAPRRTYWSDDGYAVAIDRGGNITVAYAYDTSAAHVPPVEHWDAALIAPDGRVTHQALTSAQLDAVSIDAADVGRPVIYASATHVAALWNFGSDGVADAVAPVGGGAFGPQAIAFPYCTAGESGIIPTVGFPTAPSSCSITTTTRVGSTSTRSRPRRRSGPRR